MEVASSRWTCRSEKDTLQKKTLSSHAKKKAEGSLMVLLVE